MLLWNFEWEVFDVQYFSRVIIFERDIFVV